jgi:SAM-dependent MidA family methyltransferase
MQPDPTPAKQPDSLSAEPTGCQTEGDTAPWEAGPGFAQELAQGIQSEGGWWPFDRFMAEALYRPGRGYYNRGAPVFGDTPASGSDFVTAPELSPLFGRALARQVAQALHATGTAEVFEFGPGSGALAEQLLQALGDQVQRYTLIDLSGALRQRQAQRLQPWAHKLRWLHAWPEEMRGVVVGNEVLDAMPVQLLHFDGQQWLERGVGVAPPPQQPALQWVDRPTALQVPLEAAERAALPPGYTTEIHPQAQAFMRGLAERLHGAAFFLDYGFPQAEYYHPQRFGGTLMCHHRHRADADPLVQVGEKDITAHVNFTAMALAAQDAGMEVLGYTSQARFLINCGFLDDLQAADWPQRSRAQMLVQEHEMGELFKVLGLARGLSPEWAEVPLGFTAGDRCAQL